MSNQISNDTHNLNNVNPNEILQRFDNAINDIYAICEENGISDMLTKLKPLIRYKGHFLNLVENIIGNSTYHYDKNTYKDIDCFLGKLLGNFTPPEHLILVANMHQFGIDYNDKVVKLLKYFMRKIIKERLLTAPQN